MLTQLHVRRAARLAQKNLLFICGGVDLWICAMPVLPCARQEFWVLGSQPLTALRDCMECAADVNMRALGLATPGAYLHLEGAFFNDLRQAGAVDVSEPVRDFCEAKGLRPPPLGPLGAEAALNAGALSCPSFRGFLGIFFSHYYTYTLPGAMDVSERPLYSCQGPLLGALDA